VTGQIRTTALGCQTVHYVGGVEKRTKPLPTFFMSVKLQLQTDKECGQRKPELHTWAPSSWSKRTLRL